MQYDDPKAVYEVLKEYGIEGRLVLAEEPDLDPHTIELDDGLAIVFDGKLTLMQDVDGTVHTRGRYTDLTELIDWVRDYQAMNERD